MNCLIHEFRPRLLSQLVAAILLTCLSENLRASDLAASELSRVNELTELANKAGSFAALQGDAQRAITAGGSRLILQQDGKRNQASLTQAGMENTINLQQIGQDNQATVSQSGEGNDANILQSGKFNQAFVDQQGTLNTATISQYGKRGTATITQFGTAYSATIIQF